MSLSSDSLDDLDAILEGAGEAVTIGTVSDFGIFDEGGGVAFVDGNIEVRESTQTLRVRTGKFPAIKFGGLATIAGVQYKIGRTYPESDGHETVLEVTRTTS